MEDPCKIKAELNHKITNEWYILYLQYIQNASIHPYTSCYLPFILHLSNTHIFGPCSNQSICSVVSKSRQCFEQQREIPIGILKDPTCNWLRGKQENCWRRQFPGCVSPDLSIKIHGCLHGRQKTRDSSFRRQTDWINRWDRAWPSKYMHIQNEDWTIRLMLAAWSGASRRVTV